MAGEEWAAVHRALTSFVEMERAKDQYRDENTDADGDWDVKTAEGLADFDTDLADLGAELADALTAALASPVAHYAFDADRPRPGNRVSWGDATVPVPASRRGIVLDIDPRGLAHIQSDRGRHISIMIDKLVKI